MSSTADLGHAPGAVKLAPLPRVFPPDRTVALSDAVFAVVITLLVLGIEVPESGVTEVELAATRSKLVHQILVYFVSFWIIAMYWSQHTILFASLRRMNGVVLVLNFLFLLPVTLLPFVTQLMGANHTHWTPVLIFALTNLFAAFALWRMWRHVVSRPQFHAGPRTVELAERIAFGLRVFVGALVVGVLVALVDVKAGVVCFVLTPLGHFINFARDALRADGDAAETEQ